MGTTARASACGALSGIWAGTTDFGGSVYSEVGFLGFTLELIFLFLSSSLSQMLGIFGTLLPPRLLPDKSKCLLNLPDKPGTMKNVLLFLSNIFSCDKYKHQLFDYYYLRK